MEIPYLLAALVIAFLILSLGVHEAAHAWVANLCGDSTAKDEGRLTLNPIPHIDPFMTILLPIVLFLTIRMPFGGARPVPVVPRNLRHPLRDMMFVALAGPASNVLLAFVFMLAWKGLVFGLGMDRGELAPQALFISMYMNLLLAIFNMIPVPPLDGSRVMAYILPASIRETYVSLERFGMLLVVGLIYFGVTTAVLEPTIGLLTEQHDGTYEAVRYDEYGRKEPAPPPFIDGLHKLTGGVW